ncbi:MAG TPA: Tox-REase-5 domain-containing protein, partial [Myxococcaceae bacterium]|nr:Tox-REase-5 domain-containing protein [Myxococcaceae bacterium]
MPLLGLLVLVLLQSGCATGVPMGGHVVGSDFRYRPLTPPEHPDAKARRAMVRAYMEGTLDETSRQGMPTEEGGAREDWRGGRARSGSASALVLGPRPRPGGVDPLDEWEEEGSGWPDGVGEGRPWEVPMSLDWFQGFLVEAGVPEDVLPEDGRTLSPEQAMELLPHLVATPVTLGNFGPRRMAAHLLMEVATGGERVTRDELHARMRRFGRLRVLRPDGYLVKPTTGKAEQKEGEVFLAEDGTLRASRLEVGPFYAIEGGRLFPVDERLEVPPGARPVGWHMPDEGAIGPVAEGAVLAVVDTVEGVYRLVLHPVETAEGIARLPGAVHELYRNAPEHWEAFRHKPYAERLRTISRLTTGALLMMGTAGAGAAKGAAWGGKLGSVSIPMLSLVGDGLMGMRMVAVPVGAAVSAAAPALSATYVLHMASTGAQGGGGGWPPVGGPGRWIEDTTSMSSQSRAYQAQVTGAPKGWCYKVCRNGECAEYDGYDHKTGTLLEGKAREYDKWFDADFNPKWGYQGLEGLIGQALRQSRVAGGLRVRWHVAEPRMVDILQAHFTRWSIKNIDVVYTKPVPGSH